jgi:four helix bundle protein
LVVNVFRRRDLGERLLDYGAEIIALVEGLPRTLAGRRIADQPLRSSTSVGANYEEAQAAESHADFVHKLQIALKEIRESYYWLRVLAGARAVAPEQLAKLVDESMQLRAILSKAVATAKAKAN